MDDVTSLLQTAVSNYRSPESNGSNGSLGLSKLMGISNGSLSRKVSPNDPVSHLSPAELVKVCKETGDHSALIAMAMHLGYVLMPLNIASTDDLSPGMVKTIKESADWLQVASTANASPRLTANQLADAKRELFESIQEGVRMYSALEARYVAQQPTHLRAA